MSKTRLLLSAVAIIALTFAALTLVPAPFDDWAIASLLALLLLFEIGRQWKARHEASRSPVVARLDRTRYQRHSLTIAALFSAILLWTVVQDVRGPESLNWDLYVLVLGMIGMQLATAVPRGMVTEAGILLHGAMVRWSALRDPAWEPGKPATLQFNTLHNGVERVAKLELPPTNRAAVTAALARYAGYSPVTGS